MSSDDIENILDEKEEESFQENTNDNKCRFFDNDILCGFQNMSPEVFTITGQIVGLISAENLPLLTQNALANWLLLVAQSMLTYNAQQVYYEGGPGRYFNPKNKNIDNPDCPYNSESSSSPSQNTNKDSKKHSKRKNKHNNSEKSNINISNNIEDLMNKINILEKQMQELQTSINELKKESKN